MRVSSVIAMPANTDKYRLSVLSLEKIVWEFWQVNLVDCVMNFIVLSLSKVQEHKGVLRIERSLLERHLSHWSHRGWMVNSSMPTIVHVHSHGASPGSAHCPWHSFCETFVQSCQWPQVLRGEEVNLEGIVLVLEKLFQWTHGPCQWHCGDGRVSTRAKIRDCLKVNCNIGYCISIPNATQSGCSISNPCHRSDFCFPCRENCSTGKFEICKSAMQTKNGC